MTWMPVRPVWPKLFIPYPDGSMPVGSTATLQDPPAISAAFPASLPEAADDPLICYCFGVDRNTIRKTALAQQLHEVAEVSQYTRAGGGCGSCQPDIEDLLTELWTEAEAKGYVVLCHELGVKPGGDEGAALEASAAADYERLPALAKMAKVTEVLNGQIRPFLQGDGGDLELLDVDGNRVIVHLVGACDSCSASALTLRGLVEERLRQYVSPTLEVISV